MRKEIWFIASALFLNVWIWRVFCLNLFLGLVLIFLSILLYLYLAKDGRKTLPFLILLFIVILFLQLRTTQKSSLTNIENDDRRKIDMRLREYPPVYFKIGQKTLWIPAAHWLEQRKESIALSRAGERFFQTLDLNLFFFGAHPRERVGIIEFEKFPYILLPFFIAGITDLVSKKKIKFFLIFFIIPVLLISLIGHNNILGPFSLFPFFIVSITFGLKFFYINVKSLFPDRIKLIFSSLAIISILIIIQMISYGIY